MGECCSKRKASSSKKGSPPSHSPGTPSKSHHSSSSLQSQSPSPDDILYEKAHRLREESAKSARASPLSTLAGQSGPSGPSDPSGPSRPSGPNPLELNSAYYDTKEVVPTEDSVYFGRPPVSPPVPFMASTQKFTPGALKSALDQPNKDGTAH